MSPSMTQPGAAGWAPRPGYQASAWPSPAAGGAAGAPGARAAQVAAITYGSAAPTWASPSQVRRRQRGDVARYVLGSLGGVGLLAMLWLVTATAGGVVPALVPFLLALVPLAIVLATVYLIDRQEPEPLPVLVAAFLWGAGIATVVSLVVNTTTGMLVVGMTGSVDAADMASAVVSAPLIEESTKGLGVLVVFLIWRRTFDGAVDGVVYASVVAAGFAFAENILYFVQAGDALAQTFVVRGVFSPFAHVIFTSVTGLAIGASSRMRSSLAWMWMTPLGLAGAVALHAFWNGAVSADLTLYFLIEVPIFLCWIGLIVALRHSERMTIRHRLVDYGRAGWYVPPEITMLTTAAGRRSARRWAGARGPRAGAAMKEFQTASVQLAHLRQHAVDGHPQRDHAVEEARLLASVTDSRKVFLGQA